MPEEKLIDAEFTEVSEEAEADDSHSFDHLDLDDLRDIRLRLTAELGQRRMRVHEVLALKVGSIVTLDKMAGELTDISVNGLPLARGEIVVISDILHVRMSEILSGTEIQESDNG